MGKIILAFAVSEIACKAFPALRPLAPLSRVVSGALLAEELLRNKEVFPTTPPVSGALPSEELLRRQAR